MGGRTACFVGSLYSQIPLGSIRTLSSYLNFVITLIISEVQNFVVIKVNKLYETGPSAVNSGSETYEMYVPWLSIEITGVTMGGHKEMNKLSYILIFVGGS